MSFLNTLTAQILAPLNVTIIPDGDNQTRTTNGPGETFVLLPGDKTSVKNTPVLDIQHEDANVLLFGAAQTDGDAPVIDIAESDSQLTVFEGGSVKGETDGVFVAENDAIILNAGQISGGQNGVRLLGDDAIVANFGKITSDSRAVDILGVGNQFLNFGQVLGTGDQRNGTIYADNEAEDISIANFETGLIDAGRGNNGAGVSLELGDEKGESVSVEFANLGKIVGRGEAPEGDNTNGDGVRLFSGFEGAGTAYEGVFLNAGSIVSNSARGVEISDGLRFLGEIENSGRIFGETDGLYFGDAHHEAVVTNTGDILSDSRAVNIDGTGVVLENYGRIAGSQDQRNGTVYADGTADEYEIVNQNGGVIDAGRGNDGSAVSLQTGNVDGDVVSASLTNAGVIRGRGDSTTGNDIGDGVRIFSSVEDATFKGDIINEGRIIATRDSDAAVGIRIEDGVSFEGQIVNSGRIVANEVAIDAGDAGGFVSVLNAGAIVGNVILSAGNDTFDGSEGRVVGVVDGGNGHDILIGGNRRDTLDGGAGNDELTGNKGADVFIFSEKATPSHDVITDFGNGRDRIDVSDFGFTSLDDFGFEAEGHDILLTFDVDNSVLLKDVQVTELTSDDFIF